jgi:hypothetical protein
MADATFTYDALGADKVVAANNRVRKSTEDMTKASKRSGFALLEASRGIEDFAVAGMRGALNNIPGFIMSLGAGAGIAGAATVSLVAVMQLTKFIEQLMNKAHEAKLALYSKGIALIDLSNVEKDYQKDIEKSIELMEERINAAEKEADMIEFQAANTASIDAKKEEVALMEEILRLTKANATEEEKRQAKVQSEKNRLNIPMEEDQKSYAAQQDYMKVLQEEMSKVMSDLSFDGIKAQEEYNNEINALARKHYEVMMTNRPGEFDNDVYNVAIDKANEYFKNKFGSRQALIENQTALAISAKQRLPILQKEIEKQQQLLDKDKARLETSGELHDAEMRLVDMKDQMAALEAQSKLDQDAKRREMRRYGEKSDMSGMLSSQGRSGLAPQEVQRAMSSLNMMKSQLDELKAIKETIRSGERDYYKYP